MSPLCPLLPCRNSVLIEQSISKDVFPTVDNITPSHLEPDPPGFSSSDAEIRLHDNAGAENHAKTSVERNVRRVLLRIYIATGIVAVLCFTTLLAAGFLAYRQITQVDPVKPDYSSLDEESDTYWIERVQVDIETATKSAGTDEQRAQRLRNFVNQTASEAMTLASSFGRAKAVTDIAIELARQDINIVLDSQLRQLGNTNMIVSMRARALISQALMHLRKERNSAAQVTLLQYNQLLTEADLRLNSSNNEESFFGAATVLHYLKDYEGLIEHFEREKASTTTLGIDQRMRAYRLIAGEQARTGLVMEALETAGKITSSVELARAWSLILQYSARPPKVLPVEPIMLDLLDNPQAKPATSLPFAKQVAEEIFQHLADHRDINTQTILLQRIAGSRLMCDVELHKLFRQCLAESEVLHDRVKQGILKLLDDPESPTIRAALNMPPRTRPVSPQMDSTNDDWSTSEETVFVEATDIDPTPLRTRADQQWIEALLAIAQGYQSIRRFHDADRVLQQAFVAAKKFTDLNIRVQLLLRIGEQQIAVGSTANAKQTFAAVVPALNQQQKGELARLQILCRLFDDAFQTISSIETPANREYVCSFLLQAQIRTNRLGDAEKTLALMPQDSAAAAESRSRLNVAKGEASRSDYSALGLTFPEGNNQNWELYCVGLIQQGFLHLADQTTDRLTDAQKQTDLRARICREHLSLYRAFNDVNDPNRTIRQEIQQAIVSAANRTGQPVTQAAILTELLVHHAGHLHTEADRAEGKRLWTQAIEVCRKIGKPDEEDKIVLFAQLIVVKNMLENPNLAKKTNPLFTRETNALAFAETNSLIDECLAIVNSLDERKRWRACAHLARALVQIGRTSAAQVLLDHILSAVEDVSNREMSVPTLLAMIPVLRAMNSVDVISMMYRVVIDDVAEKFSNSLASGDIYEWRMRDSEMEQIVRSQMENGFVDDAVESAYRLNEPVLRERLLRTAAYIYLDLGHMDRAEFEARRLTVKEFQSSAVQNVQVIKRRAELRR